MFDSGAGVEELSESHAGLLSFAESADGSNEDRRLAQSRAGESPGRIFDGEIGEDIDERAMGVGRIEFVLVKDGADGSPRGGLGGMEEGGLAAAGRSGDEDDAASREGQSDGRRAISAVSVSEVIEVDAEEHGEFEESVVGILDRRPGEAR